MALILIPLNPELWGWTLTYGIKQAEGIRELQANLLAWRDHRYAGKDDT